MRRTPPYRQVLIKLALVMFLVAHAPLAGLMTAAHAFAVSGDAGSTSVVICTDAGVKLLSLADSSNTPTPNDVSGHHECLCPCATLCASPALPQPVAADALSQTVGNEGKIVWHVSTDMRGNRPLHPGPGHPRAPPA